MTSPTGPAAPSVPVGPVGADPPPPPFPPGDPRLGALQNGYPALPWMRPAPPLELFPQQQLPVRRRPAAVTAVLVVALVLMAGLRLVWGAATPHDDAAPADKAAAAVPADPIPPAAAPTSGVDLGPSPTLAIALPRLEAFVEEARGHHFVHPPTVTPLSDAAFLAKLQEGGGADATMLAGETATYTALHLIPAGTDLATALTSASDQSVGGFFEPATKQLYVRSTTLDPLSQVIVVHELTHALDDQYFDVGHLQRQVRDSDQAEALRSLLEGSARSVEDRFRAALVPAEKARVSAQEQARFGSGTSQQQPPVFVELQLEFPYEVGEHFVDYLRSHGGTKTLDAAFLAPPVSTLQVLDPGGAFVPRVDPGGVQPPQGSTGRVVDRDTLGAFGLAAMLSDLDPKTLLHQPAVASWDGDVYTTTRSGGQTCVTDVITTSGSPAPLMAALRTWLGHHRHGRVSQRTHCVTLTSCVG